LLEVKPFAQDPDDVTVDGRVLAEGHGSDEVVVKADELLLEVERPLVEPKNVIKSQQLKVCLVAQLI
jgi:hypothetical protein